MASIHPAADKDGIYHTRFYREGKVEMIEIKRGPDGDVILNVRADAIWRKPHGWRKQNSDNITYRQRFAKPTAKSPSAAPRVSTVVSSKNVKDDKPSFSSPSRSRKET